MINRSHGVFPFFHSINLYSLFTFLPILCSSSSLSSLLYNLWESSCKYVHWHWEHILLKILLFFHWAWRNEVWKGICEWNHLIFWETSFKIKPLQLRLLFHVNSWVILLNTEAVVLGSRVENANLNITLED